MAEGVLTGLARWPVKSLGGERLEAARLDWRGSGATAPMPCSTCARAGRAAG